MTNADHATEGPEAGSTRPTVVLVTGAGRSGTSTVTGVLKYLGVEVPAPEIAANESNPRGFFETKWVVWRNRQILQKSRVRSLDADPHVRDEATRVAQSKFAPMIRAWIDDVLSLDVAAYVIKDPRTIWTAQVWTELLEEAGYRVVYLTMLRHPVEVLGSRRQYYQDGKTADQQHALQTSQLAGWVNVNLESERLGQGRPHAFVRYDDLLADWRGAMRRVRDELDLEFNHDLDDSPHEVDSFVEPTLRRVRGDWDDTEVPDWLRVLAESTWDALGRRARDDIDTDAAGEILKDVRSRYETTYDVADALVSDRTRRRVIAARPNKKGAKGAADRAAGAATSAVDRTPSLAKVPARELVTELRARLVRKVRRSA